MRIPSLLFYRIKRIALCLFATNLVLLSVGLSQFIPYDLRSKRNIVFSDSLAPNLLWQPFDIKTVVLQVGGASLYGGLAGAAGFAVGLFAPSDKHGLERLEPAIYFGLGASAVGLVYGVQSAGDVMGGNGYLIGTVGGTIVGGGVAALSAIYFPDTQSGRIFKGIGVVVGALSGPILGYHLTATPVYEARDVPRLSLTLSPIFDRGRKGVQLCILF